MPNETKDLARQLLKLGVPAESVTCWTDPPLHRPDLKIVLRDGTIFGRVHVRKTFHPRSSVVNAAASAALDDPRSIAAVFHKRAGDDHWVVALRAEDFARLVGELS